MSIYLHFTILFHLTAGASAAAGERVESPKM